MRYLVWILLLVISKPILATTFQHHDWELACDNTLTCRAVGYNPSRDDNLLSVLFTRHAGSNQPVHGKLKVFVQPRLQVPFSADLWINKKHYGDVTFSSNTLVASLSQSQVQALVSALSGYATIELKYAPKNLTWRLSDKGSTATFFKMDEMQRRTNTTSAMIRKGHINRKVASAKPKPIIHQAPVETTKQNKELTEKQKASMLSAIKHSMTSPIDNHANCDRLFDHDAHSLTVSPLSDHRVLVSTLCWRAAYNAGTGYWVLNDKAPFQPTLVTTVASSYKNGKIYAHQKGRGLGDCWSFEEKVWNGHRFLASQKGTTGMCRRFPEGTWALPTMVSHVVTPQSDE